MLVINKKNFWFTEFIQLQNVFKKLLNPAAPLKTSHFQVHVFRDFHSKLDDSIGDGKAIYLSIYFVSSNIQIRKPNQIDIFDIK